MQRNLKKRKGLAIFLVLSMCAAMVLLGGCSMVVKGSLDYEDADKYTTGGATLRNEIDEVEVNWVNGSVNIDVHDGDGIRFAETAKQKLDEETALHYWVNGKTLIIQFSAPGLDEDKTEDLEKALTLSLPKDLTLKDLSVNTVDADLEAKQVQVKEFCFESVGGDAQVEAMTAKEIDASTVGGEMTLLDCKTKAINFNSVDGDLTRKGGTLPEEVSISTVSGNATLFIPKDADLTIEMDAVSGKVKCELPCEYVEDDEAYIFGDGDRDWSVETVSGDVVVNVE